MTKQYFHLRIPYKLLEASLMTLKPTELKVFLYIILKTWGWRKEEDWIAHTQLCQGTNSSRKAVSTAIAGLSQKNLILITDKDGKRLSTRQRQHVQRLVYKPVKSLGKTTPASVKMTLNRG